MAGSQAHPERTRVLEIQSFDPFNFFSSVSIQPEPIPLT